MNLVVNVLGHWLNIFRVEFELFDRFIVEFELFNMFRVGFDLFDMFKFEFENKWVEFELLTCL